MEQRLKVEQDHATRETPWPWNRPVLADEANAVLQGVHFWIRLDGGLDSRSLNPSPLQHPQSATNVITVTGLDSRSPGRRWGKQTEQQSIAEDWLTITLVYYKEKRRLRSSDRAAVGSGLKT